MREEAVFGMSVAFLFGLTAGSFFNVLIWRLPRGESVVVPPSRCPECKKRILPWENIPVLSWIFLRGRCSGCRRQIPLRYPLVELFTAVSALLLWHFFLFPALTPPWYRLENVYPFIQTLSLLLLIPITVIDLEHYLIPDKITLPGLVAALAVIFLPGGISPLDGLLGLAAGGGTLYAIGRAGEFLFKKEEAMGGGDIKLMAFLGVLWGWRPMLMTLVFASFLGAVVGMGVLLVRREKTDHRIPFGPFLGAGLLVTIFTGDRILEWYLTILDRMAGIPAVQP